MAARVGFHPGFHVGSTRVPGGFRVQHPGSKQKDRDFVWEGCMGAWVPRECSRAFYNIKNVKPACCEERLPRIIAGGRGS